MVTNNGRHAARRNRFALAGQCVALDGMERLFGAEDDRGRPVRPSLRRGPNRGIGLVRYADDLVVTAPSREVLERYVVPTLTTFLEERGLKLSETKTRISMTALTSSASPCAGIGV